MLQRKEKKKGFQLLFSHQKQYSMKQKELKTKRKSNTENEGSADGHRSVIFETLYLYNLK